MASTRFSRAAAAAAPAAARAARPRVPQQQRRVAAKASDMAWSGLTRVSVDEAQVRRRRQRACTVVSFEGAERGAQAVGWRAETPATPERDVPLAKHDACALAWLSGALTPLCSQFVCICLTEALTALMAVVLSWLDLS